MRFTPALYDFVVENETNNCGQFATIYFIFGTVFGGYFLFNLFVAVLKSKFEIAMAVAAEGQDIFEMVRPTNDSTGALNNWMFCMF